MTNLTLEEKQELIRMALAAREKAYAPYSNFMVGAALRAKDGRIFTGCNVENASFTPTSCAERTALLKAVSEGRRTGWMTLAIAGRGSDFCWPCGACRQMLYEFAPGLRVPAARGDGAFETATLDQLMPHGFGPLSLK